MKDLLIDAGLFEGRGPIGHIYVIKVDEKKMLGIVTTERNTSVDVNILIEVFIMNAGAYNNREKGSVAFKRRK